MTGTVGNSKINGIIYYHHPVKITGNNIFWFIQEKIIREMFRNFFLWCKNSVLKALRIIDGIKNFFLLFFYQVALRISLNFLLFNECLLFFNNSFLFSCFFK